jgi:DNA-binding CsgD family transcriptional regulator
MLHFKYNYSPMLIFNKRIFAGIFLLFFSYISPAYGIHPTVRNFSRQTMKAGTQNWDVVQHENNWMYFANNTGLVEFDGNRWTLFPISNHTNVRALYYEKETGRIYAGAFNEFGYYERNRNGILMYHSLSETLGGKEKDFNEIWKIQKAGNTIFFQGGKEIFQYKGHQLTRYNFDNRIECSGAAHDMYLISIEREGVFMKSGELFIPLPKSEILRNKKLCAILPFNENNILFVTDFHGLFVFDGTQTSAYKTDIDRFLSENQVFCADIKNDNLAIGTVRNGLVVKNMKENTNIFSNIYTGLQNNTVLSVKYDFQDNLWLGLDKGIDYIQINSPVYDLFGNNQMYGSGYTSLIKDGQLYLGTNQGLYVTDYPVRNTPHALDVKLIPNMQGQVWCLREIDGQLFCGTDHGAFIINNRQAESIGNIPGTWSFYELKKHPGCILGSSYQGFFILKKTQGKWALSNFVKGFEDSGAGFEEDEEGNIWFAHWMKGISKLTFNAALNAVSVEAFGTSKGFYTNRNNTLYKIDNRIIFSGDGGFFEYDKENNKIKHARDIESIFGYYPSAVGLEQTAGGDIWMTTPWSVELAIRESGGNYQFDKTSFANLKTKLIPGFQHINYVNDKNVIINTENGFAWIDTSKRNSMHEHIKVAVHDVYLTGERDSLIGGYLADQTFIPEFKNKENSIRFEFVASEYRDDIPVNYSFFLENYDSDWSAFAPTNIKEYTKLPNGNYTFRVRAESALDNKTAEASYKFIILPPWYQSWPALASYFVLLLFGLYTLVIFVDKRSEKGALEMKAQKEKEMQEQEERFKADSQEKEKEIVSLKNQKLQYELRHKSQELANSTMNLIRKNEILLEISQNLDKVADDIKTTKELGRILKRLFKMQDDIKKNIERDDNWKKFEANFDMVYENYLKRLGEQFPVLTVSDKKLCAYLKMGLSSKDIAPLLNMSFRSVEMNRYRLRKKLNLNREVNLTEYLQNF